MIYGYIKESNIVEWIIIGYFVLSTIYNYLGYFLISFIKNTLLSIVFSLATLSVIITYISIPQKLKVSEVLWSWGSLFCIFLSFFFFLQLYLECRRPNFIFKYVHSSVKNNNIDNCIWSSVLTGNLLKIITKNNEQHIVFPKYSSSYDCKQTRKKYMMAFPLKKGKVINNRVEYYEDNTKQILYKMYEIEQKNHIYNYLFEQENLDQETHHHCCKLYKDYPKVPFYQILSEYEERIDFKDIVSISIINLPNLDSKSGIND